MVALGIFYRYGYTNLLRLLDQMDKLVDLNLTPGTTECYVSLHKPRQSQSLTGKTMS